MNNTVVVDTSIAIKWVLSEDDSVIALALLTEWISNRVRIVAPALLAYEASTTLYHNVLRGKIVFETAKQGLNKVILRAVRINSFRDSNLSLRAMELAQQFKLPATYDASFLALAEREECELWTADTRLWRAAQGEFNRLRNLADYKNS
jgi:predicted nucleic acid-binding protein